MPTGKKLTLIAAFGLIALTLLAFFPLLRAGFIWDDDDYVTKNANLLNLSGLVRTWTDTQSNPQYYPLVITTFWVEHHLWDLKPLGYHLDNILIHAATAFLLWRLLLRLQLPPPAAWFATAMFAVHPLQVESVGWVTERKNVLSGFLYFAAMLVYLNSDEKKAQISPKPSPLRYLAAFALFTCALFAKTVAASWPAAILVIIWWKRGSVRRGDLLRLLPFFGLGLVMSRVTAHLELTQIGAVGKPWDLTGADRCIIAGRVIWFYVAKTLWPHPLMFIYPRWDLNANRSMQLIYPLAAASVVAALILLRRKIGRSPAAAGLLYIGTLFPALGFVNVYPMRYSFVADHFQYLAIIALLVPLAVVACRLSGRLALILLIPLVALTWSRCEVFHDSVTLWIDTAAKNNGSYMVHINLGQALEARGDVKDAEQEYIIATVVGPEEADTWYKLGGFQASHGRFEEAEANLRRALLDDPDNAGVHKFLDMVLRNRSQ